MNMRLKIFVACCALSQLPLLLSAQAVGGVKTVSSVGIFVPPVGATYAYEMPVAPVMTMRYSAMLFCAFGGTSTFNDDMKLWAMPGFGLSVESRRYYNYMKRQLRGKNVRHNASAYVALQLLYVREPYRVLTGVLEYDYVAQNAIMLMPRWGLRRSMGRHFCFDGSIGVGIGYGELSGSNVTANMMLAVSYVL